MLARRMGRPGLLGMAARTAVVAGTASATANAVNRRQAERWQTQQEAAAYEQQAAAQAAPAPAPAADAGGGSLTEELAKLGTLHGQGVLSDEEFAAAKRRILG